MEIIELHKNQQQWICYLSRAIKLKSDVVFLMNLTFSLRNTHSRRGWQSERAPERKCKFHCTAWCRLDEGRWLGTSFSRGLCSRQFGPLWQEPSGLKSYKGGEFSLPLAQSWIISHLPSPPCNNPLSLQIPVQSWVITSPADYNRASMQRTWASLIG